MTTAILYLVGLGAMIGLAAGISFTLRAVKLI